MNQTIRKRIEDIKNGVVPEGYKKTKVGIVPFGWEILSFKDVTQKTGMRGSKLEIETLPICSINNRVGFCRQDEQFENEGYSNTSKELYVTVKKGEFAYNPARINVGSIGLLKKEEKALISSLYVCFKFNPKQYNSYFEYYFKTHRFNFDVNNYTEGSVRQYLFYDNFSRIRVAIPSTKEQERMAEILETQDKVIKLKEKLVEQKKQQKKYLTQQLLTGKKRLPGFTGGWKLVKIGNSFKVVSGYPFDSKNFTDSGVSVIRIQNIDNGMVNLINSAKHNKFNICQDNVAHTGDVLIAMSGATTGKIGVYLGEEQAYINQRVGKFIGLSSGVVEKQYLIQILFSQLFFDKLKVLLSTGAQPNIGSGDLEKMKFMVPLEIKEQQAIANILSKADKEIELLQKGLEEEKVKKKALMQLLLTGIVRCV